MEHLDYRYLSRKSEDILKYLYSRNVQYEKRKITKKAISLESLMEELHSDSFVDFISRLEYLLENKYIVRTSEDERYKLKQSDKLENFLILNRFIIAERGITYIERGRKERLYRSLPIYISSLSLIISLVALLI